MDVVQPGQVNQEEAQPANVSKGKSPDDTPAPANAWSREPQDKKQRDHPEPDEIAEIKSRVA